MTFLDAKKLAFGKLLDRPFTTYVVPVYQRNYAWGAEEIKQLVDDLVAAMEASDNGNYFLGNLVVQQRTSETHTQWEVVDGQQRLTTLFILDAWLRSMTGKSIGHHSVWLTYKSRPRSAETLRRVFGYSSPLVDYKPNAEDDDGISAGVGEVSAAVENAMRSQDARRELNDFSNVQDLRKLHDFLVKQVELVRIELPSETDLNRYFEVMNTRGQQLEAVDIVKARLMHRLSSAPERETFAKVWDACGNLDEYVQMPLTRGQTAFRKVLFGDGWSWLEPDSWEALVECFSECEASTDAPVNFASNPHAGSGAPLSLDAALHEYGQQVEAGTDTTRKNEQFRSVITFPSLLLHVLAVVHPDRAGDSQANGENDSRIDDAKLISEFEHRLGAAGPAEIGEFCYRLLRLRNAFDAFVIKREYTAANNADGSWSLDKFAHSRSGNSDSPTYKPTFSHDDPDARKVVLLESMLRVTYTSPKSMRWLTELLRLLDSENPWELGSSTIVKTLKSFVREGLRDLITNETFPRGFAVPRIAFTYLDYLLVERSPELLKDYSFGFRTSIEHFSPQNPSEGQGGIDLSQNLLNDFGNLALLTVSSNSRFGNLSPLSKVQDFGSQVQQSPKLALMAEVVTSGKSWDDEAVSEHRDSMLNILRNDVAAATVSTDGQPDQSA